MIHRLLSKIFKKPALDKESDDVITFARTIEKLIDETSLEIFRKYNRTLLNESNIYIVPAVWGAVKDGELTSTQKEIHARVYPVIQQILDSLCQEEMSSAQKFAIGYLVRGLFISKTIYMIEFYKNLSGAQISIGDDQGTDLRNIETMGHA